MLERLYTSLLDCPPRASESESSGVDLPSTSRRPPVDLALTSRWTTQYLRQAHFGVKMVPLSSKKVTFSMFRDFVKILIFPKENQQKWRLGWLRSDNLTQWGAPWAPWDPPWAPRGLPLASEERPRRQKDNPGTLRKLKKCIRGPLRSVQELKKSSEGRFENSKRAPEDVLGP